MANLRTEFCGLEFKNPIVVASAEPGNSLENISPITPIELMELLLIYIYEFLYPLKIENLE